MDELIGGLDVSVQVWLLDLLCGFVCDIGLFVVLVMYDLVVVWFLVDWLMVMKGGYVIESGLIDQVLDDLQYVYIQFFVFFVLQV